MSNEIPEGQFIDARTGEKADLSSLEDAGVGFDPATQHLDLSKDEKLRTTALMLAIQGYKELIIKDAEYLRAVSDLARRDEGPKLQGATMDAMVHAAIKFEAFLLGRYSGPTTEPTRGGSQTETETEAEQQSSAEQIG